MKEYLRFLTMFEQPLNSTNNMKYIFGAYGTNNVGDEAIFEGAKLQYENLVEIYVNKSTRNNAVWYADLLNQNVKFDRNADELIIGGGGLLHCANAVNDYTKLVKIAKSEGLKTSIKKIGCENFHESFKNETIGLFYEVDSISVRSEKSKQIVNNLGFDCIVEKDFAYNLQHLNIEKQDLNFVKNKPTIGIALGRCHDAGFKMMCNTIKTLLSDFNIVFIPHSNSFVSAHNNDTILGHTIWSSIDIYHKDREKSFKVLPYNNNPNDVLRLYKSVDIIVGSRFHSFIFSEITNTKLIGIKDGLKTSTYFDENQYGDGIPNDDSLYKNIFKLLKKNGL